MKEPRIFKEVTYPERGVELRPESHAFIEWTEVCAPGTALAGKADEAATREPATGKTAVRSTDAGVASAAFDIVGRAGTEQEYVFHQALPTDARAATRIRVRVERDARVRLVVIQQGAAASHVEVEGVCVGDGSAFELYGLHNPSDQQKQSLHAVVCHEGSHSRSDMKVWCVGRDQTHSIFNGKIDIRPGARHVEAYQRNKNLMLSPKATMDTFPKLFIANDEVKAAHGASVSALEVDQLTYLQSRGIGRAEAEAIVTRGFIHQVVEGLRDPKLRARVEERLGLTESLQDAEGWDA